MTYQIEDKPICTAQRALQTATGVGFKAQHFIEITEKPNSIGFFEIHAENYMGAGGPAHRQLAALRADYALSIHGVGLSIGGNDPLDRAHLLRLKALCERYQPALVSEHLAWSRHGRHFLNDLLPLPLTKATLAATIAHVDCVQNVLRRKILVENPATYLRFAASAIPEPEFLKALAEQTGCGLLLDINNVYVSAHNHGFDAAEYLAAFATEAVGEIHLAGHSVETTKSGATLLIDTHGEAIADPVFALYAQALARTGQVATLIERDNRVPDWATLAGEAKKAADILERAKAPAAAKAFAA